MKKKFSWLRPILSLAVVLIVVQGCYASRLGRPKLTGYVFDAETKQPIAGCLVGEVITDDTGYYELEERRYRAFTWIGGEAPPLFVNEYVCKDGYEPYFIEIHNPFGGGLGPGAHHEVDPIYLIRKSEKAE